MSNNGWFSPRVTTRAGSSSETAMQAPVAECEANTLEGMDNDDATLERERTRLQAALQSLDLRVVIEAVQREATCDNFVLSAEAYAVQQRIRDVVLERENQLQYSLCEVRVQRARPNWPKAQLPWTMTLALRRLPLKRARYSLPLFFGGKALLCLTIAYLLYFLYRLHAAVQ